MGATVVNQQILYFKTHSFSKYGTQIKLSDFGRSAIRPGDTEIRQVSCPDSPAISGVFGP